MKCSCPKCSALLQEDLPSVPEKGLNPKCPECAGRYWIHRESFMLRCYTVSGERYCASCGEALGMSTYCPGCGTLYPDYCVVAASKPARRDFAKSSLPFDLSFARPRKKSASSFAASAPAAATPTLTLGRRPLLMVALAVVLIAAIAVGAMVYLNNQAERKFTKNFVVALYGIKTGTDQSLKKSALLASGTPLRESDLAELSAGKTEIDAAVKMLATAPDKFSGAHKQLAKLHGTYEKLYTLSVSSGPSPSVAEAAGKLESQFREEARALKSGLPPQLADEIRAVLPRYRNLRFMVE